MKRNSLLGASIILLTVIGCASNSNDEEIVINVDNKDEAVVLHDDNIAQALVNNCFSCHAPMGSSDTRIAPPMGHVKAHYIEKYKSKDEFVSAMSSFVNSPNKEAGIMYGALEKFGVMPNMQFDKEVVNNIVNYIYDNDIDSDEWLTKYNKTSEPTFADDDYMGKGRHIVMTTKKQLGKNLKKTIKTKGTKEAVSFCSVKAYPILDSMSTVFNANIVRVSNKNRNPKNKANAIETEYIINYQTQLDNGEELKPIIKETEDLAIFYMPIVTNDMCLQCHGPKNNIDAEVLAEIKKHYPNDKATGYDINQIRGIWRIEMPKTK